MGNNTTHLFTALQEIGFDKVYLITGKRFLKNAEEVKEKLSIFPNIFIEIKTIDPFSSNCLSIIINYISEVKKNENSELLINITGGTNLMGAAALSAAYYTKSQAYYVLDKSFSTTDGSSPVVYIPIPKISLVDGLTTTQKDLMLQIEKKSSKKTIKSLKELADSMGWTIQRLKPHIHNLEEKGLVQTDKSLKEHSLKLTEAAITMLNNLK